jgi:hypothetical protein
VPKADAAVAKPDAGTQGREQDAANLVRIAAESDSQVKALQALVRSYLKTVNGKP